MAIMVAFLRLQSLRVRDGSVDLGESDTCFRVRYAHVTARVASVRGMVGWWLRYFTGESGL